MARVAQIVPLGKNPYRAVSIRTSDRPTPIFNTDKRDWGIFGEPGVNVLC